MEESVVDESVVDVDESVVEESVVDESVVDEPVVPDVLVVVDLVVVVVVVVVVSSSHADIKPRIIVTMKPNTIRNESTSTKILVPLLYEDVGLF